MVWCGPSADQGFAEAGHRVDDDLVAAGVHGVCREEHAGGPRIDHPLHDDIHLSFMLAGLLVAICEGPRILQRTKAVLDCRAKRLAAFDVQNRLVLPGKRRVPGVFSDCRGPNRDLACANSGVVRVEVLWKAAGVGADHDESRRYIEPVVQQTDQPFGLAADRFIGNRFERNAARSGHAVFERLRSSLMISDAQPCGRGNGEAKPSRPAREP